MKQQTKRPLKTRMFAALVDGLASVGALYAPGVTPLGASMFQSPSSTCPSDMGTAFQQEPRSFGDFES